MRFLERPWEQWGLAVGRIAIGFLWFTQLLWKLPPSFGCPSDFAVSTSLESRTSGLCDWVGLMAEYSIFPLHRDFVDAFVAPNVAWMGWLIFLLEAFLAVSLIFGFLTRLGAALGFLQALNLYLGLSGLPFEWYWTYLMLVVLHWVFFFTTPGRVLGVDVYLIQALRPLAEQGNRLARGLLLLM